MGLKMRGDSPIEYFIFNLKFCFFSYFFSTKKTKVWGLELTTASRAAFLVQLTTVIVPVMEAFIGQRKLKPQVRYETRLFVKKKEEFQP